VKLLLDTHLLIWAAEGREQVPAGARVLMEADENSLYFSVASLWEIAIKSGLKRADFQVDARILRHGLIDNGYHELAISGAHAVAADLLPPIHRDPFDRVLIAQACVEGITLLTDDATVAQYPGPIRLA
jgi:PIN domain nuclease of toxin-antitoxin system